MVDVLVVLLMMLGDISTATGTEHTHTHTLRIENTLLIRIEVIEATRQQE